MLCRIWFDPLDNAKNWNEYFKFSVCLKVWILAAVEDEELLEVGGVPGLQGPVQGAQALRDVLLTHPISRPTWNNAFKRFQVCIKIIVLMPLQIITFKRYLFGHLKNIQGSRFIHGRLSNKNLFYRMSSKLTTFRLSTFF